MCDVLLLGCVYFGVLFIGLGFYEDRELTRF